MGYPSDLLSSRAVVKPGLWAVLPEDGLVNNVIPYLENTRVSIIASPKMGASFVQYIADVAAGGGTIQPFAKEAEIEGFLYVVSGKIRAEAGGGQLELSAGGYLYAPPARGISFRNAGTGDCRVLLYKQRYLPLDKRISTAEPAVITGNVNEIPYRIYEDMENVLIKDLLPAGLAYDMNMHILSFKPGGCHPIVETHVQEHGAYILSGQGMYYMDESWLGIKQGDYMWFGPYVPQCAYGVGTEPFTYIYSKDCNRDVQL